MPIPHASWANCYDFAYENSYGALYHDLTDLTISTIRELRAPPCSLVDFGAGTGRLTIPLATMGYTVTAVEPCQEMMDILLSKAATTGANIQSCVQRMEDFQGQGQFDVALCVFTTVLYLLDEVALNLAMANLAQSLKRNGKLLIDIPGRRVFQGCHNQTTVLQRNVEVIPNGVEVYIYREKTRCLMDGKWTDYEDIFPIRYWPPKSILDVLAANGIKCESPITGFRGTGSDYYSGTKC